MSTTFHTTAELRAALNKLAPAMGSGFTITTASGEQLSLLSGRLADRLADELSQGLRLDLMRREHVDSMAAQGRNAMGLKVGNIIGEAYHRERAARSADAARPVRAPAHEACALQPAAEVSLPTPLAQPLSTGL